ncbi:YmfL family putative regulatory protein [Pantoea endophytica]
MVDAINIAVRLMCNAHPEGRRGMAADMGMTLDVFQNHLGRKCGSRFFTLDQLQKMEDLSGTTHLAEYFANRKGLTLVDIPSIANADKVDLYDIELSNKATAGKLAIAKQEAIADGVIDQKELKTLSGLFQQKMRGQILGFLGFLAIYGVCVTEHSVDLFMSNRRTEVGMQIQAAEA